MRPHCRSVGDLEGGFGVDDEVIALWGFWEKEVRFRFDVACVNFGCCDWVDGAEASG